MLKGVLVRVYASDAAEMCRLLLNESKQKKRKRERKGGRALDRECVQRAREMKGSFSGQAKPYISDVRKLSRDR